MHFQIWWPGGIFAMHIDHFDLVSFHPPMYARYRSTTHSFSCQMSPTLPVCSRATSIKFTRSPAVAGMADSWRQNNKSSRFSLSWFWNDPFKIIQGQICLRILKGFPIVSHSNHLSIKWANARCVLHSFSSTTFQSVLVDYNRLIDFNRF